MTTIVRSHQIFVDAPLQAVFDYVSDLTRHPEWSGGELQIEAVTSDPVGIGKEYISRGKGVFQKAQLNQIRILHYVSPHLFGFIARDPNFGDVTHEFKFTEVPGGVLVERVMTLMLPSFMAFAFRSIFYPTVGKPAMNRSMVLLQKRLERQHALVL